MDYTSRISGEELLLDARRARAFWEWRGGTLPHARLRTGGLHSDGFFSAKKFFEAKGMLGLVARQMKLRIEEEEMSHPLYIAGIPTSATALGKCVAGLVGSRYAEVEKFGDGSFRLVTRLPQNAEILIIEDVTTTGESVAKVARAILAKSPHARILPQVLVLLNRGGRGRISVHDDLSLRIEALIEKKITEWDPAEHCYPCTIGSEAISPKEPAENWDRLMEGQ